MTATSRVDINDLLAMNVVSDARIAPGGDRVAYCVGENGTAKGEKSPPSNLRLRNLDTERDRQITFGGSTDHSPRWAPDGRRLAMLSDREKRGVSQVYLLDDAPGDARKLTGLDAGVGEFAWNPSGDSLYFTSVDHTPESDNDVKLYDAERRFNRLYRCDVDTAEAVPIAHGDMQVWEFCVSPDGASLAAIVSDDPDDWSWYSGRLVRIDVQTGEVATVYSPERQIARPAWSPDGSRIAFISSKWSDPGMTGGDVLVLDLGDGTVTNLTEGDRRSHFTVHWMSNSQDLVSFALDRARAQICRITMDGATEPCWTDSAAISDYGGDFDPVSNTATTTLSRFDDPPDVWIARLEEHGNPAAPQRVTRANENPSLPGTTMKWLTWKSVDGLEIEGIYYAPAESSSVPPPLVTLVHGGPTAAATPAFPLGGAAAWTPFLIEQGMAVLLPNYRGSTGYGVDFAEANLGDLGGLDLQDILTGIDACVSEGLADPDRLGITGWSYGGYITAWAITQTNRFKAAVAGASITNWHSFHGGSNIPGFDQQYLQAAPDELDGPYAWRSPLFACKQVSTPTLFIHGELDPCCPVGQAYEMARSLRLRGVPVECAVYPREGHGFVERAHRRDMTERAVGWFRRYLGES